MMPPEAPETDPRDRQTGPLPAASSCLQSAEQMAETAAPVVVLAKRADFLRAAQARRQSTPGFLLQARERRAEEGVDPGIVRVGFTCSKKIGNAVTRNRAKRRLRSLVREILATQGRPGWDYVLVGRPEATISRVFAEMLADFGRGLRQVHDPRAERSARPGGPVPAGKRRGKSDRKPPAPAP